MLKRLIYLLINIAAFAAVILFLYFDKSDSNAGIIAFIIICLSGGIALLVFQIILIVSYAKLSQKNYDFLFMYSCFFSIIYFLPYVLGVYTTYQIREAMTEIGPEMQEAMGQNGMDYIYDPNPWWGIHAIAIIPLLLQIVVYILRARRYKALKTISQPEIPSEPNLP